MKQVTAIPSLPANDWRKLLELLREFASAINQAAQGFLYRSVSVSTTYTAGTGDLVIYVVPTGTFTVTLPAASDMLDKVVTIKRKNNTTHTITIQATSGNFDNSASVTLTSAYQVRAYHSDGANYWSV